MELLFILIIAAIFVSVVTGNLGYILFGMSGFLLLFCGFLVIIFSICSVILLLSKWKEARFLRMDLPTEKSRFRVAVYSVEGEEVPCLFPEEGIFRKIFYRTDRTYHVLYNKKLGRVFDRFAVASCVLGLSCGIGFGAFILAFYF